MFAQGLSGQTDDNATWPKDPNVIPVRHAECENHCGFAMGTRCLLCHPWPARPGAEIDVGGAFDIEATATVGPIFCLRSSSPLIRAI
jgi:hypothetical protein